MFIVTYTHRRPHRTRRRRVEEATAELLMVLAAMRRVVRTRVVFEDIGSLVGDRRALLIGIANFLDSDAEYA